MKMYNMILPVFAYKEENGAISIYKDELGKKFFCQFSADHSNKPTKRNKRVTLECWQWQLNWITFRFTTFDEWRQKRLKGF